MPLAKPTTEDLRKLHAEANLNFHERFLITTLAITLFGVIGGWLFSKSPPAPGSDVGGFAFAVSILLTLMLLMLFLYSRFLRGQLRVVTSYLIVTNGSSWEVDWKKRRRSKYFGYWKAQSAVFLALGVFTLGLPFLFEAVYKVKLEAPKGLFVHLSISVVYIIVVFILGFREMPQWEEEEIKQWQNLNKSI